MGSAGPNGQAQTILVVEDAEAVRKLVCAILSHHGYRCLEAADGIEALEIVDRAGEIHLVLTDVIMPQMGGAELAHQLAILRPELRIIFMSGYIEEPMARYLEQAPGLFLLKPFTAEVLAGRIRHALEQPWAGLPA